MSFIFVCLFVYLLYAFSTYWKGNKADLRRQNTGNIKKTKEKARKYQEAMKAYRWGSLFKLEFKLN